MDRNKILKADYLDILFDGRNKEYGSYILRKQYKKSVLTAVLITILTIGTFFAVLSIKPKQKIDAEIMHPTAQLSNLEHPPLAIAKPPPIVPPAPPPMLKSTKKFTPPVVKLNNDIKEVDQPKEILKEKDDVVGLRDLKSEDDPDAIKPNLSNVTGDGRESGTEHTPSKDIIYETVQQKPEFDGDIAQYLAANIRYPEAAKVANIQGTVKLSFILDEKGYVTHLKIEKDIGGGCGEEAKRVVSKMRWKKPAIQNDRPVKIYLFLNVGFNLL